MAVNKVEFGRRFILRSGLATAAVPITQAVEPFLKAARAEGISTVERFSPGTHELALNPNKLVAVNTRTFMSMFGTGYAVGPDEVLLVIAASDTIVPFKLTTVTGGEKVEMPTDLAEFSGAKLDQMGEFGRQRALEIYAEAERLGLVLRRIRLVGGFGHTDKFGNPEFDDVGRRQRYWVARDGTIYPDDADAAVASQPEEPRGEVQPAQPPAPALSVAAGTGPCPEPVTVWNQVGVTGTKVGSEPCAFTFNTGGLDTRPIRLPRGYLATTAEGDDLVYVQMGADNTVNAKAATLRPASGNPGLTLQELFNRERQFAASQQPRFDGSLRCREC